MQRSHLAKQLRQPAPGFRRSRRGRLVLFGGALLLVCSLGLGAAAFYQHQPTYAQRGEVEMEVDARGEWQPPQRAKVAPVRPPRPQVVATAEEQRAYAAARAQPVSPPREVNAAWYDVPDRSLAKRRAGAEELTAAHNRLPIGTLVRVTHLSNGKSTLVRITDRGIRDKKIKLDVCREAAEELGMVSKGIARVKMEIVREEPGTTASQGQVAVALP